MQRQRFAGWKWDPEHAAWVGANAVCRAAALVPGAFDVSRLPVEELAKPLDDRTMDGASAVSGWTTRALLALRRGDTATAMRCIQRAYELRNSADSVYLAVLLSVRALVLHASGDDRAALTDAEKAELLYRSWMPLEGTARWDVWGDSVTPVLLVRELRAALGK
jgi:ATP/maltotriose-dependent transcriptional regulator MalT